MKRKLLLAGVLTTFFLVAKSQVGINTTNPQGIFNIDGLKNNPATGVPTAAQAKDDLVTTSNGNLGLGLTTPGTTLDVNGAITNRETALAVTGNAATIPVNVSQVQLTGAATANVAITAFAAPNPGQRLIVYNNTTGGFGATLDGVTIPNGKALEFVFSNSFWRSTDGGAAGASPVNIYTANGTLGGNRTVTTAGNSLAFTNGANNVTIGTTGTEGIVTAKGSSRGSFLANGGAATLSMYANDNGKAIVTAYGNSTSLDIGSSTAIPVNVFTNNTQRMIVDSGGNVGIGTTTPDTKLTISTPNNSFGLNHTNGTISLATHIGGAAASVGTTTANDLRFMTNNTQKMTVTSAGDVGIGTVTPDTKLTISTGDSSFGLNHTNGTINLKTYIGGGAAFMGTTTSNDLYVMTNNSPKMKITAAGDVGIGTSAPSARLEINSGSAGVSGLKFTNLDSATPVGTGQAIGVDSSGNVITVSTSAQITTVENAVSNVPGSTPFNVTDLGYTIVPGSVQNITIPSGGKALFINFMLGIDYVSSPAGGGTGFYQATLFIDNIATNVYQTVQESGAGSQAQFNLSSVRFLNAGSHTLNVRMIRKYNNGTTSGAVMGCTPISISFNSSYVN